MLPGITGAESGAFDADDLLTAAGGRDAPRSTARWSS